MKKELLDKAADLHGEIESNQRRIQAIKKIPNLKDFSINVSSLNEKYNEVHIYSFPIEILEKVLTLALEHHERELERVTAEFEAL